MNIILPSQYKRTRISLLLISLLSLHVATANAQDITQEPAEQTAEEKTQKILEQAYKKRKVRQIRIFPSVALVLHHKTLA